MNQLPHHYQTCNCGPCKMIRLELKRDGHTGRAVPTGPIEQKPPSKPKQKKK